MQLLPSMLPWEAPFRQPLLLPDQVHDRRPKIAQQFQIILNLGMKQHSQGGIRPLAVFTGSSRVGPQRSFRFVPKIRVSARDKSATDAWGRSWIGELVKARENFGGLAKVRPRAAGHCGVEALYNAEIQAWGVVESKSKIPCRLERNP